MFDIQAITEYLSNWQDPRGRKVADAVRQAQQGQAGRQKASLALADVKDALPISPVLKQTTAVLHLILGKSPDVIFRNFLLGVENRPGALVFLDGMVKKEYVMPVLENVSVRMRGDPLPQDPKALAQLIMERGIVASESSSVQTIGELLKASLSGDTVMLVEGLAEGFQFSTRGWEHRMPEESVTEPVVRGPKEGFTETVAVNLSLVRRRIQDERVRAELKSIGTRSATAVFVVYIEGLTQPDLVNEVRSRLDRINIDGIMDSGYIEELISDTTLTPFPLMKVTERPDVVVAELLEGRVVLLVDGTPHALAMPTTFAAGMQAAEDYYQRWPSASFTRLLRYVYLMVALLGPSVYIALLTFHHEMLPTDLLLSIMTSREGVPFPALVEALLMEFSFEVLREAGIRLPKPVGQAVSIVGALVIGEAAVRAGLVSPAMVIVVAITGISSFVIPMYSSALAIRLLRFPMMVLAGTFGFFGILVGLLAISVHLSALRSFGVPYMSPTMPPVAAGMDDMMIRVPWWAMRKRPKSMPVLDRQRMDKKQAPKPPK